MNKKLLLARRMAGALDGLVQTISLDQGVDMPPVKEKKRQISVGLPNEGFVRLSQILTVIPVSKTSWWNGVREGRYPQPVKLGPRTTVWRVEEIRDLISGLGK